MFNSFDVDGSGTIDVRCNVFSLMGYYSDWGGVFPSIVKRPLITHVPGDTDRLGSRGRVRIGKLPAAKREGRLSSDYWVGLLDFSVCRARTWQGGKHGSARKIPAML